MRYEVTIQRIEYREHPFIVEACSDEDAEQMAMELASNHDFAQETVEGADYNTTMICALEDDDSDFSMLADNALFPDKGTDEDF